MKVQFKTRYLGEASIDTDELSEPVREYIFAYGLKQSIDDAGAGERGEAGSQARLDALIAGTVPRGGSGGGARIGGAEAALREVLAVVYRSWSIKAAAATKLAKAGKAGYAGEVRARIAHKNHVHPNQIDAAVVAVVVNLGWAKIAATADRLASQRAETLAGLSD